MELVIHILANKLYRMRTAVKIMLFWVPSRHLCGQPEKNHENFQSVACLQVKFESVLYSALQKIAGCYIVHCSIQ